MSFAQFKVIGTGEYFYYENANHALFNSDGDRLNFEFDSEKMSLPTSSLGKSKNPKTIKIVLGHACNYSCGYCVQKDIGNANERAKNANTQVFIQRLKQNINVSGLERVELWGGETLLYWPDIIEIMGQLDRVGLTWYIPTNGTTLMNKHVDFFASLKGKVTIGISHDGPGHVLLRGPEFLHKKIDVLKNLQKAGVQFSFNPVISLYNYDLFALNDFFANFLKENGLAPVNLVFELGRVYDKTLSKNSYSHIIHGEHIQKYSDILKRYLKRHKDELRSTGENKLLRTNLFHFGNGALPYAVTLKQQRPVSFRSNCGVDLDDLISFDINGNVRTCQNTGNGHLQGTVDALEKIQLKGVNLTKDGFCENCSVSRLCKSSCPIDLSFDVFHLNHLIEKAHYTEIQLSAFELMFNSVVELVEENVSIHSRPQAAPVNDFQQSPIAPT
ncbi:MAG: hypothetical protein B7Y39_11970 [Bdellovibrio sp. 28-41-41]|nr:MAG: hypothetical protein B7Y39_11970 [Bdellovibrio sp. 28-41-41]